MDWIKLWFLEDSVSSNIITFGKYIWDQTTLHWNVGPTSESSAECGCAYHWCVPCAAEWYLSISLLKHIQLLPASENSEWHTCCLKSHPRMRNAGVNCFYWSTFICWPTYLMFLSLVRFEFHSDRGLWVFWVCLRLVLIRVKSAPMSYLSYFASIS